MNYRTSHQIRARADHLLPGAVADVDGLEERRAGVTSVFNGPDPDIRIADDPDHETEVVADWLRARIAAGIAPHEIGVFVRTVETLPRAAAALDAAGIPHSAITVDADAPTGRAARATMHIAKGMEFRAVVVMACDEDLLPLAARIEAVADESDLDEVYATERHLLYVACTRARDHLETSGNRVFC
jgi:superfamily I DNA/RNA helicase